MQRESWPPHPRIFTNSTVSLRPDPYPSHITQYTVHITEQYLAQFLIKLIQILLNLAPCRAESYIMFFLYKSPEA